MPTFNPPGDLTISVGSSAQHTARVLQAPFGRNYSQRSGDGKNNIETVYNIVFDLLTEEEFDYIDDFLKERAGWESFEWTPPGKNGTWHWTCKQWAPNHTTSVMNSLSATFERTFFPD